MKRGFSIALGIVSIGAGAMATLASLKALFLGAFVGVVGLPFVLLVVAAFLLMLVVPGALGIAALVLSARHKEGSTLGLVLACVGCATATVLGVAGWSTGETLKPSSPAKAAAPPDCKVVTTDVSAINRECTLGDAGSFEGDCPPAYWCSESFSHVGKRYCQIGCVHDCACPKGTHCTNASCQRGKDLPP